MDFKEILFEKNNRIATLTLNRPEIRNAISSLDIIEEIEAVCQMVNNDMSINVLIITAKDPAFSAGGNIKDMAAKKGMFGGTPAKLMENYRKK